MRIKTTPFLKKKKKFTWFSSVNEFATAECNILSVKKITCTIFGSIYEKPAKVHGVHAFPKNKMYTNIFTYRKKNKNKINNGLSGFNTLSVRNVTYLIYNACVYKFVLHSLKLTGAFYKNADHHLLSCLKTLIKKLR